MPASVPSPSRGGSGTGRASGRGVRFADDGAPSDAQGRKGRRGRGAGAGDWESEEYDPGDDGEGGAGASGRALREAKRLRRLRREGFAGADAGEGKGAGDRRREGDEDDDSDHEDEDAGLVAEEEGVPITPFNMEEEETDGTGYFDGDTYVFRRGGAGDRDEEPDAWVDGLDDPDTDVVAAAAAAATTTATPPSPTPAPADSWTDGDLYAKMLPLVSDTETVAQAIVRYGNLLRRGHRSRPGKRVAAPQEESDKEDSEEASRRARDALNDLTEAAGALMLRGHVDVYQKTRRDLEPLLPVARSGGESARLAAQTATETDETAPPAVQWEYLGSQDGRIHGPFSTRDMLQWIQAGYFVGPSAVKVRTVREAAESSPNIQDDLLNDLLDDDDDNNNNNNNDNNNKDDTAKRLLRGEWEMSDQVHFSRYR